MKPCIVIPCFNHADSVAAVARAARAYCPVLIVDDGSAAPVSDIPECSVLRLTHNCGKGAALLAGFDCAAKRGFTHVITMDADGQHFAADIPRFLAASRSQPDALIAGVRDFYASGCPLARRWSNWFSTFWFRAQTGVRLSDSQCGFRCYPLKVAEELEVHSGRYAFEWEFLMRASWRGVPIVAVPVQCIYERQHLFRSHFRPVRDFAHIALVNLKLLALRIAAFLPSFNLPRPEMEEVPQIEPVRENG